MLEYRTYGVGDRTYVRAQQAWLILTAYVRYGVNENNWGEGIITYETLGITMGYNEKLAGLLAVPPTRHILKFCKANNLPLLSAMVVNKKTGLPGWDYDVPDKAAFRKIQTEVRKFNWFKIRTPTGSVFKKYPIKTDKCDVE